MSPHQLAWQFLVILWTKFIEHLCYGPNLRFRDRNIKLSLRLFHDFRTWRYFLQHLSRRRFLSFLEKFYLKFALPWVDFFCKSMGANNFCDDRKPSLICSHLFACISCQQCVSPLQPSDSSVIWKIWHRIAMWHLFFANSRLVQNFNQAARTRCCGDNKEKLCMNIRSKYTSDFCHDRKSALNIANQWIFC